VAEWHLRELEERLLRRGWNVEAIPRPENVQIGGSWKIERGDHSVILDFYAFDDLETFPIEQAYAVKVRDQTPGLYFGKKPTESRPQRSWEQDIAAFVAELDQL
jgi:hypothetical protein